MVVGLGNPGPRYAGTRHNVGFDVVSLLAGPVAWHSRRRFDFAQVTLRSRPVLLVRPTTYMNDSGPAVEDALEWVGAGVGRLLVFVDDLHVAVGRLRIRRSGSDGGHNGLSSIIETLGSEDFARARIGVGQAPPGVSQIDHVLGQFETTEADQVRRAILTAAAAARSWCADGVEVAMNLYNGR